MHLNSVIQFLLSSFIVKSSREKLLIFYWIQTLYNKSPLLKITMQKHGELGAIALSVLKTTSSQHKRLPSSCGYIQEVYMVVCTTTTWVQTGRILQTHHQNVVMNSSADGNLLHIPRQQDTNVVKSCLPGKDKFPQSSQNLALLINHRMIY